jgi:hypothetical protein
MEEMGLMRTRTGWLALLLVTVAAALAPTRGWAQGETYEVPQSDPAWNPLPLYSDRPEKGGLFVGAEFLFWRQTNPLKNQIIAIRGIQDDTGAILGAIGVFGGSGTPALYADDAGGPLSYQPGFEVTAGWRFENGVAVSVTWWHLIEAKYSATASLIPRATGQLGFGGVDTFLFSPVYGFPTDYAGPNEKIFNPGGTADETNALYGIWNGATEEQITFTQRFDQYDIDARIPVFQDDNYRCYAICGGRMSWIWERFWWRTVDVNINGVGGQDDVALYTNMISNRLWGPHCGAGTEWLLCNTPIGTFSWSLEGDFALLVDFVNAEAKYERGDFETSSHRRRNMYTIAPELSANANLWWYPLEGIQLRVGYDVKGFFNTISSPYPVTFNYGGLSPAYDHEFLRFFDGLNAGIAFIF